MNEITEEIKFPDFEKIIMHCKTLMSLKFPDYKNTWDYMDYEFGTQAIKTHNKWWQERLKDEVNEFLKAENKENAQKELCDIINICSMIYQNTKNYHDPYWRYS